MSFLCDKKYQNVILELQRRGWSLLNTTEDEEEDGQGVVIPRDCLLLWRNLSKIKFASVCGRYVNHIKG